jgi:capsule polysaccharide export protein KpsE/RkpR
MIPNTFKSTAVVMIAPESSSGLSGLTSLLSGKSSGSSISSRLLGGSSASEDMIFGILNSRTALADVLNKFNLIQYYEIDNQNLDKALKAFTNDLSFDLTENNFIQINVVNKYPEKCADIANYFIVILDSLNNKINSEAARNNRKFIETRYLKNLKDLKNAEDSLFRFQKKYGVIAVPEQFELLYKASAEIEAQSFQKQILADLMLQEFGENSPQYQTVLSELNILNKKIEELKQSPNVSKNSNIFLPFNKLPKISMNFSQIYREVEIQNKILEVILPMYEQAKIEEVKNIPSVIVIDKAIQPQIKYRPQRSFIVLSAIFLCLFISIPFVFRMHTIITKNSLNNPLEEKELKIYNRIKKIYKIKG